jgi:ketosteroid isomerase-like protein
MSQLNVDVIRSVYDAFESRDMDGMMQNIDDDVQVVATEGLPWSGIYNGQAGFEEFIRRIEDHVNFSLDTEELLDSGSSVAQIGRINGQVHATRSSFDLREIHIWGLREGKVVSFQNYIDTRAQRRALGLPEVEPPSSEPRGGPGREPFWG